MTVSRFATVAQMVYAEPHTLSFPRLVGELHSILERLHGPRLMVERECEDIAFFDILATRIALGWDDKPGKGYSACLTVSVGSLEDIPPIGAGEDCEEICSRLVEGLHRRLPALAILWHQTEDQVTADLLDRLVEGLPPLAHLFDAHEFDAAADELLLPSPVGAGAMRKAAMESDQFLIEATPVAQSERAPEATGEPLSWRSAKGTEMCALEGLSRSAGVGARIWASAPASTASRSAPEVANDRLRVLHPHIDDLARLRAALYPSKTDHRPAPLNTQMRLTAHAMNATLIIVWAPLGAAVMTYSLLKGENMKFSSRLMVLAGLFGAVLNTPMGQQMAAMAGV